MEGRMSCREKGKKKRRKKERSEGRSMHKKRKEMTDISSTKLPL
jgi:hypothetical protein